MFLRTVELVNWRSYKQATFTFPPPHQDQNVVLVKAPNEHGKTSFFEAVTIGLFGVYGLHLVPRTHKVGNTHSSPARDYSSFLEGVLHQQAIAEGLPECYVKLDFVDDNGEGTTIKRKWHFHQDGRHNLSEDQLVIYSGPDYKPVAPPASETHRDHWYRDWIAGRFLHPDLAQFFLFDGEHVQRYADPSMSGQVRRGIEGLLGLPVLRELQYSLNKYAVSRRRTAAAPSDSTVRDVTDRIAELDTTIEQLEKERDEVVVRIPGIERKIDEVSKKLAGTREGTVSLIASLLEDARRHETEAQSLLQSLFNLVASDLALANTGIALRDKTIETLSAEQKLESWESDRKLGNERLAEFARDFGERLRSVRPAIRNRVQGTVMEQAKAAWEGLWHPPPDGCASAYFHEGLTGSARSAVIDRLEAVARHSSIEIAEMCDRIEIAQKTAEDKEREAKERQQTAPQYQELTAEMQALSKERADIDVKCAALSREIAAAKEERNAKAAELARYTQRLNRVERIYAEHADAYSQLIEELLKSAVPIVIDDVAREMTSAWKAMAHMSDRLMRIEISEKCDVKMVTQDGRDLHEIPKSAGASQVFTQALIVAITRVGENSFPFIVDTPLARLSSDQRLGVLKTFTDREGQVVLLSTDEEVVRDKLESIRQRIVASYELKVSMNDGVPNTTVSPSSLEDL